MDEPAELVVCFAVRLQSLLRARRFAGQEDARYYLTGVRVEPAGSTPDQGALCIATDGHALGVRFDRGGIVNEAQVCRVPKQAVETDWPGRDTWAVMARRGATSWLSLVDVMWPGNSALAISMVDECRIRFGDVLIDGPYPEWRRVVPRPQDDDQVRTFQTKHLAAFGERITMRGIDEHSPHLVFDLEDRDFVGVQMPMKLQGETPPDWLDTVALGGPRLMQEPA